MTHTLPLPDFTHERVEVSTGPRSGLVITDDGGQIRRSQRGKAKDNRGLLTRLFGWLHK